MNRTSILALLLGAFLRAPAPAVSGPAAPGDRLNVVVVLADDMGYGDLGFCGNPVLRTPHLDAMAERSARMERFYVNPFCGPTRAALLTGRYPHRSGVHSNGEDLAAGALTLAEALKSAGYATGIFGKWHLGAHHPRRAMDQGFDESLVTRGGLIGELARVPADIGRYTDPVLEHNGRSTEFEGYATDVTFDAGLDWIERVASEERAFFAYLTPNVPHRPFDDVPEGRYRDLLARMAEPEQSLADDAQTFDEMARAFAMIENLDANVGKLFARLEALGLLDDTLVVFLSDNGPNGIRFNGGMQGSKGGVYEGSLRTVFLAHCPARFEPGARSDRIAAHVDLFPTILDACDISPPAELDLDGRSLLPLLEGREVEWPDRLLFFEGHKGSVPQPRHNFAVVSQRWKLVRSGTGQPHVRFNGDGTSLDGAELFDLEADPLETQDRLADERETAARMRAAYEVQALEVDALAKRDPPEGRVLLGVREEDPVLLTHEHWERISPDEDGTERRRAVVQAEGVMGLRSVSVDSYDVVLRFAPAEQPTQAILTLRKLGKRRGSLTERSAEVPVGTREVRIEGIELEQARYELLAVLGPTLKLGRPVWQVEFRRRNP